MHQRNAWTQEWPGGGHIGAVAVEVGCSSAIRTARKLKHAVVCTVRDNGEVQFYAVQLLSR